MNTQLDVAISKFRNEILNSGTATDLIWVDNQISMLRKPVDLLALSHLRKSIINKNSSARLLQIFDVEIRPLVVIKQTPICDMLAGLMGVVMVVWFIYMIYFIGIELHMFELLGILVKWGWNHPLGGLIIGLIIAVPLLRLLTPLVILLVLLANTVHPKN